jgi:hypothetical protein
MTQPRQRRGPEPGAGSRGRRTAARSDLAWAAATAFALAAAAAASAAAVVSYPAFVHA